MFVGSVLEFDHAYNVDEFFFDNSHDNSLIYESISINQPKSLHKRDIFYDGEENDILLHLYREYRDDDYNHWIIIEDDKKNNAIVVFQGYFHGLFRMYWNGENQPHDVL